MTQPNDSVPRYKSYLLRCSEVRSQHPDRLSTWRFSLQDPETGEKHSFADLEGLVAFLQIDLEPQGEHTPEE